MTADMSIIWQADPQLSLMKFLLIAWPKVALRPMTYLAYSILRRVDWSEPSTTLHLTSQNLWNSSTTNIELVSAPSGNFITSV